MPDSPKSLKWRRVFGKAEVIELEFPVGTPLTEIEERLNKEAAKIQLFLPLNKIQCDCTHSKQNVERLESDTYNLAGLDKFHCKLCGHIWFN